MMRITREKETKNRIGEKTDRVTFLETIPCLTKPISSSFSLYLNNVFHQKKKKKRASNHVTYVISLIVRGQKKSGWRGRQFSLEIFSPRKGGRRKKERDSKKAVPANKNTKSPE